MVLILSDKLNESIKPFSVRDPLQLAPLNKSVCRANAYSCCERVSWFVNWLPALPGHDRVPVDETVGFSDRANWKCFWGERDPLPAWTEVGKSSKTSGYSLRHLLLLRRLCACFEGPRALQL